MAAYIAFIPKGDDEPQSIAQVDDAMRKGFNAEPDPVNWYRHWYNLIGFALATGYTFEKCIEVYPEHSDIIHWISDNYTVRTWSH